MPDLCNILFQKTSQNLISMQGQLKKTLNISILKLLKVFTGEWSDSKKYVNSMKQEFWALHPKLRSLFWECMQNIAYLIS